MISGGKVPPSGRTQKRSGGEKARERPWQPVTRELVEEMIHTHRTNKAAKLLSEALDVTVNKIHVSEADKLHAKRMAKLRRAIGAEEMRWQKELQEEKASTAVEAASKPARGGTGRASSAAFSARE